MSVDQQLTQGLQLLGLGMGAVFVILTLLTVVVITTAKLVPKRQHSSPPTAAEGRIQHEHIAAIQAAVHRYRH